MGKGRAPCCDKDRVKRGPWSPAEDFRLISFIHKHGHGNWRALPKQAGLLRCGKSCRLRWINYLRPDVKRGNFSPQEEETIIKLHTCIGNRWSKIASHLPGRTDNEIKNVWNTYLKKKALQKTEENSTSSSSHYSTSCSMTISSGGDQKNMDKGSDDQECNKIYEQIDGGNNISHNQPFEIPLEKDVIDDFWNILDSFETSQDSSNLFQSSDNGNGESIIDNKLLGEEYEEELQHGRWLRNLENALGLPVESDGHDKNLENALGLVIGSDGCDKMMPQPDQCSIFDIDYQIF